MPLPLAILAVGAAGLFVGSRLSGDDSEAQVIVNTAPALADTQSGLTETVTRGALLAGTALAVVIVAPKILNRIN